MGFLRSRHKWAGDEIEAAVPRTGPPSINEEGNRMNPEPSFFYPESLNEMNECEGENNLRTMDGKTAAPS